MAKLAAAPRSLPFALEVLTGQRVFAGVDTFVPSGVSLREATRIDQWEVGR
jgi:hypothetical protein